MKLDLPHVPSQPLAWPASGDASSIDGAAGDASRDRSARTRQALRITVSVAVFALLVVLARDVGHLLLAVFGQV